MYLTDEINATGSYVCIFEDRTYKIESLEGDYQEVSSHTMRVLIDRYDKLSKILNHIFRSNNIWS